MSKFFEIKAIQVEHGDAIVVSYGQDPVRHMLIDGGPKHSFPNLLTVLENLCINGKLVLETIIVSHYDNDHIEGIIELLKKNLSWLKINDIWFNGHKFLSPSDSLGPKESDELSLLISNGGYPWNKAFKYKNVKVDPGHSVELLGGMKAWILSPMQDQLDIVEKKWPDYLRGEKVSPDTPKDRLGRKDVWPAPPMENLLRANPSNDTSISNGSSIAVMLEFNEKKILLAADSFAEVVVKGIEAHWDKKITINVLKISHHGSHANTSDALLKLCGCRRFIISTNGKVHAHPDQLFMARLLSNVGYPEVIFNYHTDHTARWAQAPRGWPTYLTTYPSWNEPFVRVTV